MTAELPKIGETVAGRYELLDTLGEGGMSVVFRAHDRQTRSEVALKLLIPRYLGRPEREQRLLDEARYLERLRGAAGIVELIDHGRLADRHDWPFLVTKILRGRALNWQLIKHKFTPVEIRELALGIARALGSCHALGIIHRDVTPSNISVVLDPLIVELFDFSHASSLDVPRVAPGDSGRLTGVFDVPGTSGYMGPEQASSAPADAKMDVFSFGVLLYEIITGRNPYPNVSHKEFVELQRAGNLEPPRLQAWVYEVDPRWGEVIRECTLADPIERPSIAALVEVIERLEPLAPSPAQPGEEDRTHRIERAPLGGLGAVAPSPAQSSEEDRTHRIERAQPIEEARTHRIERAQTGGPTAVAPSPARPSDEDRTLPVERPQPSEEDRPNQIERPQPSEEDRTHLIKRSQPSEEDRTHPIERPQPSEEDRTHPIERPQPSEEDRTHQIKRPQIGGRTAVAPSPAQPSEEDRTHRLQRAQIEGLQAAARRPAENASARGIGAWGPPPSGSVTPALDHAPPTPAVEATAPVVRPPAPMIDPPTPAVAPPAPSATHEDATDVYRRPAFARPEAKLISLPPVAQADGQIPPPLSRSRPWVPVLLVVGVVGLGFAAWSYINSGTAPSPEPDDGESVRGHRSEPQAPVATSSSEPGPDPEVAETGVSEPEPERVPDPRPQPQARPKKSKPRQTSPSTDDGGQAPPKPKDDCQGVQVAAERAKSQRDWPAVLRHTNKMRCWSSNQARLRLRVEALAQAKRWDQCLETAKGSDDPELTRWVKFCAKNI